MGCTKCKEKKRSGSPTQSAAMSSHSIFLEREINRYRKEAKLFREREETAKKKADQAQRKVKELTERLNAKKAVEKEVDVKNPFSDILKDKG